MGHSDICVQLLQHPAHPSLVFRFQILEEDEDRVFGRDADQALYRDCDQESRTSGDTSKRLEEAEYTLGLIC